MTYCEHVYKEIDEDICPKCGLDTHRPPWEFIREERRKHREEKGLFYNVREWWSI